MTVILGVNAFHADAAACLLVDGALAAAVEEERLRRVKHWAGFPARAIECCLAAAGLTPGDVTDVALNSDPLASAGRKLLYVLRRPGGGDVGERIARLRRRGSLTRVLGEMGISARVHRVEHHLAHLASSYLASPFDEAVAVSVDGFGDFASTAWGLGVGARLEVSGRVHFPHSLGIFYQALTQYLGFPDYGDEYKVMGLAAHGQPLHRRALEQVLELTGGGRFRLGLEFFRHHREHVPYRWDGGAPSVGTLYSPALEALLGPARSPGEPLEIRHRDLAASTQALFEDALFHLLSHLRTRWASDALCLSGGCAMNSVANGRLRERTGFNKLYVQPAAGDAGGALGAALAVQARVAKRRTPVTHAYLGPGCDEESVVSALARRGPDLEAAGCTVSLLDATALIERAADLLAEGAVLGWFQGRMEWGPRALGNRSILCDPTRADAQERMNERIKRRESFRPFAPVVLVEHLGEWFDVRCPLPFMTEVVPVRAEARARIPAVTHVDGTARVQTVAASENPRLHALIRAFAHRSGVPMLLNTSFNEREPIVCTPDQALDCFLRTRMEALALGSRLLVRGGRPDTAWGNVSGRSHAPA